MFRSFASLFFAFLASTAQAQWCSVRVTGLPELADIRVKAVPEIPKVYASARSNESFEVYELQGSAFIRAERPLFVPGNADYGFDPIRESDGSVNFNRREKIDDREYEDVLYRVTADGTLQRVLQTRYRDPWSDPVTGRIFAYDGHTLMEYVDGGFAISPLNDPRIHLTDRYHWPSRPRYVPALNAWILVAKDALWTWGTHKDGWQRIDRVKTWRNDVRAFEVAVYHDVQRALVIVQVDVSVLVFDVSGAEPKLLYQRLIAGPKVSQAGNGGVLIEPLNVRKDIGWFARASVTRMLTRTGAQPVPGAVISDNPRRKTANRYSLTIPQRNLGDTVLVFHPGGVALFDGHRMIDRPDLKARFPEHHPFVQRTWNGVYLQRDGLDRWTAERTLQTVLSPDGDRAQWVGNGFEYEFFRAGDLGFVVEGDGTVSSLSAPAAVDAKRLRDVTSVPFRKRLLVEYESGQYLFGPCESLEKSPQ